MNVHNLMNNNMYIHKNFNCQYAQIIYTDKNALLTNFIHL